MFISYAQNCEDVVLWRVLRHVEHGTYVDVGAADPAEYSVTKAFYDRGWSGINVEPAPEFVEKLNADRPRDTTFALCAGDVEGPMTLHYVPGTGLSTLTDDHLEVIAEKQFDVVDIQTEVKRLDTLLADAGFAGREIHFLKIDVEGAEESVLRSIDLATWRPWVIVVEATEPTTTTPNHQIWESILLDTKYEFCLFDGLNRFYRADEHPELAATLSYPAGVFDQPYAVGVGQNELAAQAEVLVQERDNLAQSYAQLDAEHRLTIDGYNRMSSELSSSLDGYAHLQEELKSCLDSYKLVQSELGSALAAYDELHTRYDHSIASYDLLTAEYELSLSGLNAIEVEYRSTLEGYARLHAEYDNALAGYTRVSELYESCLRELQTCCLDAQSSATHISSLESELRNSTDEITAIKGSTLWKMSQPVRRINQKRSR